LHQNVAQFRFYEELNDFLPPEKKKQPFAYHFSGMPAIKDAIEAEGVPHTEIDLILVNGTSVGFDYRLQHGDRVSVYPVFESLDIAPIIHLRAKPLRETTFILDVHLGKLARLLRMLGFDALYSNEYHDAEIIERAIRDKRIILTRDRGILKTKVVTHGYWIRSAVAREQVYEVLKRFDGFSQVRPFHRCIPCNGVIERIDTSIIISRIPPKTAQYYDEFSQCSTCKQVYWKGPHYQKMYAFIQELMAHQHQ
jgi:uncharacterized protein with PIN domain